MSAAPPMTRARWAILAAGLPVVLALIGFGVNGWVTRSVIYLVNENQVSVPVGFTAPPANGQIRVSSSQGDLTVRTGTGPRITVAGLLTGSFVRPSFRHRSTADGLTLDPQCHVPGNCSLNLGITVPARMPVSIDDSFGTLGAQGLNGTVTLWDNTGDLTASRLTGTVHLTDSFGTLAASRLAGSIRLDNNTGDIQAAGITGDTQLQDSFGTISVTGLDAASVRASNNTGDIYLAFSKVPRQLNVTDSFGNITLVLPAGPATYHVTTRDTFGRTTVSVPQSPAAPNVITASNNTGDITIVTAKVPAPPVSPGPPPPVRPAGPAAPVGRGLGDGDVAGGLDRPAHHARVHVGPRYLGMNMVRPEHVHPVLDGVKPVRGGDRGMLLDKGRLGGIDLPAPRIWHISVDKYQLTVGAKQFHQFIELLGGDDVIGAEADHYDRAQPPGLREPAHDGQPRGHLPVGLGVDVDTGHGRRQSHGTGGHDRVADGGDLAARDLGRGG